ncbi:hypothetical protein D3C81_2199770 [compost metagenome]
MLQYFALSFFRLTGSQLKMNLLVSRSGIDNQEKEGGNQQRIADRPAGKRKHSRSCGERNPTDPDAQPVAF